MFVAPLPHLFVIGTHKNFWRSKGLNIGCLMSRQAQARTRRGPSCHIALLGQRILMRDDKEILSPCIPVPPSLDPEGYLILLFSPPADKGTHHAVFTSLLPGTLLAHLHQLYHSGTGDPLRSWAGGRSSIRVWTEGLLLQWVTLPHPLPPPFSGLLQQFYSIWVCGFTPAGTVWITEWLAMADSQPQPRIPPLNVCIALQLGFGGFGRFRVEFSSLRVWL